MFHFVALVNIRCLNIFDDVRKEFRHLVLRFRYILHHIHDSAPDNRHTFEIDTRKMPRSAPDNRNTYEIDTRKMPRSAPDKRNIFEIDTRKKHIRIEH